MTHREKNNYRNLTLSDTHFHYIYPKDVDTTVDILRTYRDFVDLESIVLCGMSRSSHRMFDPINNLKGLYCKDILGKEKKNGVYVFGAPFHLCDERDTAEGYLKQVSDLYDMGVDGYKILDGKPTLRKMIGKPLCDPIFDKMYEFIEEKQMPVKMHLADPIKHWGDKSQMSEYALKMGWYYGDGTFPTVEELRNEVKGILTKFPKLKLCLAHFGFMTENIQDAVDFLENWENTAFDMTPGASNFVNVSNNPKEWRAFFEKYAHRLYFGSDTYNHLNLNEKNELEPTLSDVTRKWLEWPEDRKVEYSDLTITPMNFPDHILKKIYNENRIQLLGDARPLNAKAIVKEADEMIDLLQQGYFTMESEEERLLEIKNAQKVKAHFLKLMN